MDADDIKEIVNGVADEIASRDPRHPIRELLHKHFKSLAKTHAHMTALANFDIDERANEEYFRYVLSPDCSSCRSSIFDTVSNRNSESNDDVYGDRTAYYMTGALFGCHDAAAAQPDCAWDYDSYACSYCTLQESDGDLGYHATLFPEAYESEATQLGVCGVYPQGAY